MTRFVIFGIILFLQSILFAQDSDYSLGARHSAIGGTSLSLTDGWCLFNNIGGIGDLSSSQVFVSYQNRYNTQAFQTVAGGVVMSGSHFNSGLSFYRFGDELFNLQRLGFGIGNRFQMVSLGLSANLVQYRIEGQGVRKTVVMDFGGIVEIVPSFRWGAFVSNLSRSRFSSGENVPFRMKSGLSYRPFDILMLNAELEKEINHPANVLFGLEYAIHPVIRIRTGITTDPRSFAAGFGLSPGHFLIDYAFKHQGLLGPTHEYSITWILKDDKE